jgi:hypothetical protein
MKKGADYGEIPGVKNMVLFQPGAQKLGLAFQLRPEYTEDIENLPGGHKTYNFKCVLISRTTNQVVGEGVGTCSTAESKYRYRWDNTGKAVPAEYWKSRDKALLGGQSFTTRKSDGKWLVFMRVDHPDPADYYNTARKMGKKRAYVDAMIMTTACSHIFTQDVEDMNLDKSTAGDDNGDTQRADTNTYQSNNNRQAPQRDDRSSSNGGRTGTISQKQVGRAMAIAKSAGADDAEGVVRDWQVSKGFVDADGQPTFSAMTRADYDQLCDVYLPKEYKPNAAENDNQSQQREETQPQQQRYSSPGQDNRAQAASDFDDDIPF